MIEVVEPAQKRFGVLVAVAELTIVPRRVLFR
jgi:hypothetical protein